MHSFYYAMINHYLAPSLVMLTCTVHDLQSTQLFIAIFLMWYFDMNKQTGFQ